MNSRRRFNPSLLLKNSLSAKWLYLPILILSILWTTYSFATQINSNPMVLTEKKHYVEVVVQPGQTLWLIATKVRPDQDPRKTVWEIEQENGVTPVIQVGQIIKVPVN